MKIELTSSDCKGFAVKVNDVFIGDGVFLFNLDGTGLLDLAVCTNKVYRDSLDACREAREAIKKDIKDIERFFFEMEGKEGASLAQTALQNEITRLDSLAADLQADIDLKISNIKALDEVIVELELEIATA